MASKQRRRNLRAASMWLTFKIYIKCFTPYIMYVCAWRNGQQLSPATPALMFCKTVDILKIYIIFFVGRFLFFWFCNL